MKKILVISPNYPPLQDGLSDHTFELIQELKKTYDVSLLTSHELSKINEERVNIFPLIKQWKLRDLTSFFKKNNSYDRIIFQYVPFLYKKRGGINFQIIFFLFYLRFLKRNPVSLIVHELYFPFQSTLKSSILHSMHKLMLIGAITASNKCFFSTLRFLNECKNLLPLQAEKYIFLPVGSTVNVTESYDQEMFLNQYNLDKNDFILTLFGPPHPSKNYEFIIKTIFQFNTQYKKNIRLLFVGSKISELERLENFPFDLNSFVTATGKLPTDQVVTAFNVSKAILAYFTDGLSTRRSSVMSALKVGIPVISTQSVFTEEIFSKCSGIHLFSTDENLFKEQLTSLLSNYNQIESNKEDIKNFYNLNFSWNKIAQILSKN